MHAIKPVSPRQRRRFRIGAALLAAFLLLLAAVACTGRTASTPEEAAQLRYQSQSSPAGFKLMRTVELGPDRVLVFFRDPNQVDSNLHYALAKGRSGHWSVDECCSMGGFTQTAKDGQVVVFSGMRTFADLERS